MSDFDVEPIPGLPALLPDGEELLWQGAPLWGPLAKRALFARAILLYFGILIVLRGAFILVDDGGVATAVGSALWLAFIALVTWGVLSFIAYSYSRTTIYSITSRRVVIRSGVIVPVTVNLPFKSIQSAGLRVFPDGSGDIPLTLIPEQKVMYWVLWPNVRPSSFSRPLPMLWALPEGEKVAELLAGALKAEAESDETASDAKAHTGLGAKDASMPSSESDSPPPAEARVAEFLP